MNTRDQLPNAPTGGKLCVYCRVPADTNDHAPPRCLLQRPLPSNLITLPACRKCNSSFSFDENVVRAFVTHVGTHATLVEDQKPSGWLERACNRNPKLRHMLEASRQQNGTYRLTEELVTSFENVFRKTVQGLFFGLYNRVVAAEQLQLIRLEDRRAISPEEVIIQLRPCPLRDITDEPLSEITPNSWHSRQPILILQLKPISGGQPIQQAFRVVRDTPVEWVEFQPGVFRVAFVKLEEDGGACVFDVWQTLVISVKTPWPDDRGPLRRGKRNPLSRERKGP